MRCLALCACISEYLALLKGHLCPNTVEAARGESGWEADRGEGLHISSGCCPALFDMSY